MKRTCIYWLWTLLAAGFWLSDVVSAEGMPTPETPSPTAIHEGAVSRAIGASVLRTEQGVRILADGLSFEDVTSWGWQGRDIAEPLQAALAEGSAAVHETDLGFELEWNRLPMEFTGLESGLTVESAAKDIHATVVPLICSIPAVFGAATEPARPVDAGCGYDSTTCLQPGKRHTGMDFSGTGAAIAIADGTVVRVETLNMFDHGMGNNVLVRHVLPGPNCDIVYSGYAHLASIDPAVTVGRAIRKGQTLGLIGGSGDGDPNRFPSHLHLEMKSKAVSGNPFGVGDHTKTCANDPANAMPNTCWRYVAAKRSPDEYGYLDPAGYLDKRLAVPVYREVSAGDKHTCALKADNTLVCWGWNYYGQATPPAGTFKQASAGSSYTCAVDTGEALSCWGSNLYGQASPPTGAFKQVSSGAAVTCGLRLDNSVACWGSSNVGQDIPPGGPFRQVSVGRNHTCGLKADTTVACWGYNDYGQANPPAGTFKDVSAGGERTCAVKTDGTVVCWGRDSGNVPFGTFKQVSAGSEHICGLKTDGTLACWGDNDHGQTPPLGTFKRVSSASGYHTCAVKVDDTLACWGPNNEGQATPPLGTKQMAVGSGDVEHACALRADGTLVCYGNNDKGQATPPSGVFTRVVAGAGHGCALRDDATVACWGETGAPPAGQFKQLSARGSSNLALRTDGMLFGWGLDGIQASAGRFKQASKGGAHACAIRLDDTLACWGTNNDYGQATPPEGMFKQVSAGAAHNCAVRRDNRLVCWGWNADGQASPQDRVFRQVSAGERFTCGIRGDYTLTCWGRNDKGQATPPSGAFLQVSAGDTAACAVRIDGIRVCWGKPIQ